MTSMSRPYRRRQWLADCHEDQAAERAWRGLLAMLLSIVGTIQLFNEPQIMSTADPGISKSYTPMMMAMNTSQGTITPSGDGPASPSPLSWL